MVGERILCPKLDPKQGIRELKMRKKLFAVLRQMDMDSELSHSTKRSDYACLNQVLVTIHLMIDKKKHLAHCVLREDVILLLILSSPSSFLIFYFITTHMSIYIS